MSRLVICAVFFALAFTKTVIGDVKSCYACAGPDTVCVFNNRTDFLKMDCSTFLVENQSLIHRTSQPDLLEKFDSEVGSINDNFDKTGCITLRFKHDTESPAERALKSCVPKTIFNEDICNFMTELVTKLGAETTSCHFCEKDDCNAANSLTRTKFTLFILCLIYVYRYIF